MIKAHDNAGVPRTPAGIKAVDATGTMRTIIGAKAMDSDGNWRNVYVQVPTDSPPAPTLAALASFGVQATVTVHASYYQKITLYRADNNAMIDVFWAAPGDNSESYFLSSAYDQVEVYARSQYAVSPAETAGPASGVSNTITVSDIA